MQVVNVTDEMLKGKNDPDAGHEQLGKYVVFRRWLPGLMLLTAITLVGFLGKSVSPKSELDLISQMANAGDDGAELQLGLAYRDGRFGLSPDAKTGLFWLKQSAASGNAYAEDAVAQAYASGQGTEKNNQLAAQWWRKAIDDGNKDARIHLSESLIKAGHTHQAEKLLM
jgi:TPR repeat protein